MATLRFHQPIAWLPQLTQGLSLLLVGGLIGLWSMRLLAPTPLPVPVAPLPNSPESGSAPWRGLFSENGMTTGPIVLRGVIVGSAQDSVAVLSVNGTLGRAYRIGSEIAPGLRLVEVNARSVTLERNGVRNTLTLAPRIPPKIVPIPSH